MAKNSSSASTPRQRAREKASTGYDSARHPREQLAEKVDLGQLRELIEPVLSPFCLVLEDLTARGAGSSQTLQVVVDLPEDQTGAVELDALAEASRAISQTLDEHTEVPASPYLLEVTSPGATRKLTLPRHWKRSIGRLIAITTQEGERFLARLDAVEGQTVHIRRKKETKKGQPVSYREPEQLTLEQVAAAQVELEFTQPALG